MRILTGRPTDRGSILDGVFSTASKPAAVPPQPPNQCVAGEGAQLMGHEADHAPLSTAEVKNDCKLWFHSPHKSLWCSV
jgi:hypothetical protein